MIKQLFVLWLDKQNINNWNILIPVLTRYAAKEYHTLKAIRIPDIQHKYFLLEIDILLSKK